MNSSATFGGGRVSNAVPVWNQSGGFRSGRNTPVYIESGVAFGGGSGFAGATYRSRPASMTSSAQHSAGGILGAVGINLRFGAPRNEAYYQEYNTSVRGGVVGGAGVSSQGQRRNPFGVKTTIRGGLDLGK